MDSTKDKSELAFDKYQLTPDGVRLKVHSSLESIHRRNARMIERFGHWPFGFLGVAYAAFFYLINANVVIRKNEFSFFETRYFWIIPSVVVLFSVGSLLVEKIPGWTVYEKSLSLSLAAGLFIPEILAYSDFSIVASLMRAAFILIYSLNLIALLLFRNISASLKVLVFFATELLIVIFMRTMEVDGFFGESFWLTQPMRYAFVFSYLAAETKLKTATDLFTTKNLSFVTSATSFITPLPFSTEHWQVKESLKMELKGRAVTYLILGLAALTATFLLHRLKSYVHYHFAESFARLLGGGAISYLYYYSFSFANIVIPVSLLWWMGFNIPRPYDTPLLAVTPQDRWRRWNFLFYDWYFKFIFFPVYKKTKSSFLAVLLSFVATIVIHLGQKNAEFAFIGLNEELPRNFFKKIGFFMVHALLVYLGLKFEKFLPKGNEKRAWVSVIAMFLLMSGVHYIFF